MEQEKKEQLDSGQVSHIERSATEGEVEKIVNNSDSVDMEVNSLLVLKNEEGAILETSDHQQVPNVEKHKSTERENLKEIPQVDNQATSSSVKNSRTPKPNLKNTTRKVHPTISAGTKTKLASPVTKSSRISTPTSKSIPTSKAISSSVRKENGMSYQRSSNGPVAQSNEVLSNIREQEDSSQITESRSTKFYSLCYYNEEIFDHGENGR